jgi:hypothetical protein
MSANLVDLDLMIQNSFLKSDPDRKQMDSAFSLWLKLESNIMIVLG